MSFIVEVLLIQEYFIFFKYDLAMGLIFNIICTHNCMKIKISWTKLMIIEIAWKLIFLKVQNELC